MKNDNDGQIFLWNAVYIELYCTIREDEVERHFNELSRYALVFHSVNQCFVESPCLCYYICNNFLTFDVFTGLLVATVY